MHRGKKTEMKDSPIPTPGLTVTLLFVGIVSAAVLSYQLLLTRILAVQYWSYFASMIISLAMLGFAASGTALYLANRKDRRSGGLLPWMTVLFVCSLSIFPKLAQRIECVPLMVLWDRTQLANFVAYYLLLCLPFFFGGYIIGHHFMSKRIPPGQVYFANMLGSGAGVLAALVLLCNMHPQYALAISAVPVAVSAWPVLKTKPPRVLLVIALIVAAVPALLTNGPPPVSQYKGMSNLMRMPDAKIEYAGWNRFGYLSVVNSETIRYAPGLSLTYSGRIPDQKAIFINGGGREVVCRGDNPSELKNFFNSMLSGAAYLFAKNPRVLVAGSGGGMKVLEALAHNAAQVDAVENNRGLLRRMTTDLSDFSGDLYGREDVNLTIASARAFANQTTNRYDLALVPAKGSLFASAAGTSAQDPNYLLTRQAMGDFFSSLAPDGIMAVETWLSLPPRHSAKLFATAAQMLDKRGLDPGRHLAAIRSLRTSLLLISATPFTSPQIAALEEFCRQRSFDRIYHPAINAEDANQFNKVEGAPYYNLYRLILDNPQAAFDQHVFRIEPPSDDSPYFSHFFKWAALPQLLSKSGRNVPVHIGWGYVFLLITLAQAIPLGALLILLPLSFAVEMRRSGYGHGLRVCVYFSALGAAFMLLEITAIQQFARFLPHPVYAFGITVGIFLLFSGMGAFVSARKWVTNKLLFSLIVLFALLHISLWQYAIQFRSHVFFYGDIFVVALLAFFMGMPFPRGVDSLRAHGPKWIPWAWGINGFVSVVAALASGLAALSWGLSAAALIGVACYLVAAVSFPPSRRSP